MDSEQNKTPGAGRETFGQHKPAQGATAEDLTS